MFRSSLCCWFVQFPVVQICSVVICPVLLRFNNYLLLIAHERVPIVTVCTRSSNYQSRKQPLNLLTDYA